MCWTQLLPIAVFLITSWLVMLLVSVIMTRPGLEKLQSVWVSFQTNLSMQRLLIYTLIVIKCPGLSHPEYGHVKINDTLIGGSAYYSCNRGYYLVGYAYRKCLKTGGWDGKVPVCKREWLYNTFYECLSHLYLASCIFSDHSVQYQLLPSMVLWQFPTIVWME